MSRRYGGRQASERPQQRLTARPEEIMTRAPLLQAVNQMEAGWEGARGPRPPRWYWETCPDLRRIGKNVADLRGIAWGRISVVGLAPSKGTGTPASWIVRCSCGLFEPRSAKAIRKQTNADECCWRCDGVKRLRRREFFTRHGRHAPDNFA